MDLKAAYAIDTQYNSATISKAIHDNDSMYAGAAKNFYYSVGKSAIDTILRGLSIAWTQRVNRVLDLPCGYGRVARHLRTAFPAAEMHFCDIETDSADFCASEFGGNAIHSQPDLASVPLPKNMDLIWIGSLFTHLDEERTTAWLHYLASHLAPEGILVATFHGLFFRELVKTNPGMVVGVDFDRMTDDFLKLGYGYAAYTSKELDKYGIALADYGLSLVHPSKIMEIAASIDGTRIISYIERGWAGNHDVLIISKTDRYRPF